MPEADDVCSGVGAVAVHRWFAGGEGWALHSWFGPCFMDLLGALDKQLKSHGTEVFLEKALGGFLVGERVPDNDCPDPKARQRNPFILRVALIPQHPSAEEYVVILNDLHHLSLPETPGEYSGLHVPIRMAAAQSRSTTHTEDSPLAGASLTFVGLPWAVCVEAACVILAIGALLFVLCWALVMFAYGH